MAKGGRTQRAAGAAGREKAREEQFLARGVRVVYEDEHLIVIDKPTGLVTADPTAARGGGEQVGPPKTLFEMVKRHVKESGRGPRRASPHRAPTPPPSRRSRWHVYVIHRLDKEASGLVVFAKTEEAFNWLKEDFKAKRVKRHYAAVAEGVIGEAGHTGTRQTPISEGPGEPPKAAVTHYRVLATGMGRTLLQVRLQTGRKNQIRVHMAEMGHPLVGDRRFGAQTDVLGRLGLHAAELGFTHPASGEAMRFSSRAPGSFYRSVGEKPSEFAEPKGEEDAAQERGAPGEGTPTPSETQESVARSAAPSDRSGDRSDRDTSWDSVAPWYDEMMEGGKGGKGNDHYALTILPGTMRLLGVKRGGRVLDIACGQGQLCRRIAGLGAECVGVDASPRLIEAARERAQNERVAGVRFEVGDARKLEALGLEESSFDAVVSVMALANIEPLDGVMAGAAKLLKPGGRFVWVVSHPAFRAVGQTSWGWDDKTNRQYRRVDGYLSAGQREIQMHPGKASRGVKGGEASTWTFHRPLQAYVEAMGARGLLIEKLEEWPSMRAATSGPRAPEENRARREIPLFLGVRARRV